jgi:hypothetical protein
LKLFENVGLLENDVPLWLKSEVVVLTQQVVECLLIVHTDGRDIEHHDDLLRIKNVLLDSNSVQEPLVVFSKDLLEGLHGFGKVLLRDNWLGRLLAWAPAFVSSSLVVYDQLVSDVRAVRTHLQI